ARRNVNAARRRPRRRGRRSNSHLREVKLSKSRVTFWRLRDKYQARKLSSGSRLLPNAKRGFQHIPNVKCAV
ncbi:MAG: hypothetical protein ACFCUS_05180, partial [Rubrimonas sp.]